MATEPWCNLLVPVILIGVQLFFCPLVHWLRLFAKRGEEFKWDFHVGRTREGMHVIINCKEAETFQSDGPVRVLFTTHSVFPRLNHHVLFLNMQVDLGLEGLEPRQ